jgi:hypothetical protein
MATSRDPSEEWEVNQMIIVDNDIDLMLEDPTPKSSINSYLQLGQHPQASLKPDPEDEKIDLSQPERSQPSTTVLKLDPEDEKKFDLSGTRLVCLTHAFK